MLTVLVDHRQGDDNPREFEIDPTVLAGRVFYIPCIDCNGSGEYELPDYRTIPCVVCKTAGTCPVWI